MRFVGILVFSSSSFFIINESNKRNIEIHAWINPYRISSSTDVSVLGNSSISRGVKHHHEGIDIQTFGQASPVVASKSGKCEKLHSKHIGKCEI